MTTPESIRLNGNLTTNTKVLADWSAFQYTSSVLSLPEASAIEVETDCGTSSFTLRNVGRGKGFVSAVFGDPYFGRGTRNTVYVNISRQLPAMVNNLAEFESFHSLGVLGDFWYEFSPVDAMVFNRRLSPKAKSVVTYSVLGNHDHWQFGRPVNDGNEKQRMADCAFGYGWTQFWGQDTLGVYSNERENVEPYGGAMLEAGSVEYEDKFYDMPAPIQAVPMAFSSSYFLHGNRGYVLLSGIWKFETQRAWLLEACKAMESPDVTSIWLVGHWSEDIYNPKAEGYDAHAAGAHLSTRRLFDHVAAGDLGTDSPCYVAYEAGQLKFLQGHDHWNECVKEQTLTRDGQAVRVCAGWQVAGTGKGKGTLDGTLPEEESTTHCAECDTGEFSLATLDTRGGLLQLGFLHMVGNMTDLLPRWSDCFAQMGDFSFDFIAQHCQDGKTPPLLHLWSQPLKPLFGATSIVV